MEGPKRQVPTTEAGHAAPPLRTVRPLPQTSFNRILAAVYTLAILALLYHHAETLIIASASTTTSSFSIALALLLSDLVLIFMWINTQVFRLFPVYREEFPENIEKVIKRSEFPAMDVFICTADPYKEPPIDVVNTALSVMAYDYPTEKLSVYVSDDGGSALTLFAFMEAAKFAARWLPFCRKNGMLERSPEAYFASIDNPPSSESEEIKTMYESMKMKVEHVLEKGKVDDNYITTEEERKAFSKWTDKFIKSDHPAVIQVLLDASQDRDVTGHVMPNLVYVSREKSKTLPHHFKAGSLNALIRVSAIMTNAPVVLTLDCDSCSNDPQTLLRVLCYLGDHAEGWPNLAYVQFPQRFRGINRNDSYNGEYPRLYIIQPMGFDGLLGPNYLGSGCFFRRRAFFGGPSSLVLPEMPELSPDRIVDKPICSQSISSLAHQVAGCNYERDTQWGLKMGVRYGSLSEDYFTGYHMKCEGWQSTFCHPKRAAFLGDAPTSLLDMLNQQKRWTQGLSMVGFSRYSPLTFGSKAMGLLMGLGYAQYSYWPIWSIPITAYAFLPQLALLNGVYVFPKVSEPWFLVYAFLFLGAYGQDFLDFIIAGGTVRKWWNDQRIWHVRGLSCLLFGSIEFLLKSLGISSFAFNVTSKVVDDEQSKRYEQGIFEFGVHSPMFVPLVMTALINLVSFAHGLVQILRGSNPEELFGPMFIAGFAMVNCWPLYEAMVLRSDKGKMPIKTTLIAALLTGALYSAASVIFSV